MFITRVNTIAQYTRTYQNNTCQFNYLDQTQKLIVWLRGSRHFIKLTMNIHVKLKKQVLATELLPNRYSVHLCFNM